MWYQVSQLSQATAGCLHVQFLWQMPQGNFTFFVLLGPGFISRSPERKIKRVSQEVFEFESNFECLKLEVTLFFIRLFEERSPKRENFENPGFDRINFELIMFGYPSGPSICSSGVSNAALALVICWQRP